MVSAETITDEQIRELRAECDDDDCDDEGCIWVTAQTALYGGEIGFPGSRTLARARCAEILNVRARREGERNADEFLARTKSMEVQS